MQRLAHEPSPRDESRFKAGTSSLPVHSGDGVTPGLVANLLRALGNQRIVRLLQQKGRQLISGGVQEPQVPMQRPSSAASRALQIRDSFRRTPPGLRVQRDIKGSKALKDGKMTIDFTSEECPTYMGMPTAIAREVGTVRFDPHETAPESHEIRFVQIVRDTKLVSPEGTAVQAGQGALARGRP